MHIGVPTETSPGEHRVAATPETAKKLMAQGHKISVQSGAGLGAQIPDAEYVGVGAEIVKTAGELYPQVDILLKVRGPSIEETKQLRLGAVLIGLLDPYTKESLEIYSKQRVTSFGLELLPRITRAQTMDVLSSQANIAGYKAVLLAADAYRRFFPMMMTAAGTIRAARTLVLGAGVAGLQAIATAKRLGSMVEAFDVRPAVKEQVESLGAVFVSVSDDDAANAETAGGYAREMSAAYQKKQAELIHDRAVRADIVICTALIPYKPAPMLLPETTVWAMKPGSIIVDLAVAAGGNCAVSEFDKVVVKDGVTVIGYPNLPSLVAAEASNLYARNILNFLGVLLDSESGSVKVNREDDIISASLVSMDGEVFHPNYQAEGANT